MTELYPPAEPYDRGLLDVGDGNRIHWQVSGNPLGKPAVAVHGGPGTGFAPNMARGFDPARYRVVLFDQRGCGGSTPGADDPGTDLAVNTTHHLIADMERLREHLGIDRWLISAGSWGSTLALAYAQRHPRRVTEVLLSAVTSGRRSEADWLYRGAARFFPGEWRSFVASAGLDGKPTAADLFAAYSRLLADPDPDVRLRAAVDWCRWEDAVISLEPQARPGAYGDRPAAELVAFARICAHYLEHAAWLEEGEVVANAGVLAGIPGVLLHGRQDLSCPLDTAFELAERWPGAVLHALPESGHLGGPGRRRQLMVETLDRWATDS